MSLRTSLKVPKYGLFYFPSDKSMSIVQTKKIRKVISGDNKRKGSKVIVQLEDEQLEATILGVAGKRTFVSILQIDSMLSCVFGSVIDHK